MRVTHRRFEPVDLERVVALLSAEQWESYAEPTVALRSFESPGSLCHVAVHDGRVVAFSQILSDGCIHAFLSLIVVDPALRRRGIARALLRHAFAECGAKYLDLLAEEGAGPFYAAFTHRRFPGFRIHPDAEDEGGD